MNKGAIWSFILIKRCFIFLLVMNGYEARKPAYFATPAVQLIFALHTSLKQITAQPMEPRFEQHRNVSQKFRKAVTDLGLKQLAVSDEVAANGMTAIWLPEGVQVSDIVPSLAAKGVQIAGGIHTECATKYFRIGHMGISVTEPERGHIDKVIESLTSALQEFKSKA
jgi:alanine-glyoxylate transaminase/serine-glyoxylate transaminase/serine-pyruvate transaminase